MVTYNFKTKSKVRRVEINYIEYDKATIACGGTLAHAHTHLHMQEKVDKLIDST